MVETHSVLLFAGDGIVDRHHLELEEPHCELPSHAERLELVLNAVLDAQLPSAETIGNALGELLGCLWLWPIVGFCVLLAPAV